MAIVGCRRSDATVTQAEMQHKVQKVFLPEERLGNMTLIDKEVCVCARVCSCVCARVCTRPEGPTLTRLL